MPGRIGLYYPWIHFRDEQWVKLSMLYWKQLRRIVPSYYATHDSDLVRELAGHGLIQNVKPEEKRIARTFLRFVDSHADDLRERYGVQNLPADLAAGAALRVDEDRLAYIHVTKMTKELRGALVQLGLGLSSRGPERDWVGVHPKLANVYMTALAEDTALRLGLNPVTEDEFSLVAVGGWSFRRLAAVLLETPLHSEEAGSPAAESEPAAALAFSAIRTVVPADLNSLSGSKILEIREKYGAELIRFQDAIRVAVEGAGLTSIRDPDEYQRRLRETYREYVDPQVQQLERDLKLFKVDTAYAYLNVKTTLPPIIGGLAVDLKIDDPLATGATAVLLGLATASKNLLGRRRAALASNPMAYMFHLNRSLQPEQTRAGISMALARFTALP